MIHYNGPVSRTPGKVACAEVDPQAVVDTWNFADCSACKNTLVGMAVEPIEVGGTRAKVDAILGLRLRLRWAPGTLGTYTLYFREFDVAWRPVP